ncbi:MAG: GNAT family N-acetyltransferase [Alphaproteobacteria bacterium]|nr:GNAT family N-acetyltransferase [Alphaproteobacteria bacterium]
MQYGSQTVTDLHTWKPCAPPALPSVRGAFVQIDVFSPERDRDGVFAAIGGAGNDALWRYIPFGPCTSADELADAIVLVADAQNWRTHIIRAAETGEILGMASYMRIRPEAGSVEIGCIIFSKQLQRTPAASEAMYLLARHIFDDLGYRRYEWKCNGDNAASKSAAARLGFEFEGVFRQDMVVKGENRDTAWFSILDSEWPRLKAGFEAWLAPENFDADGRQRRSLRQCRGGA